MHWIPPNAWLITENVWQITLGLCEVERQNVALWLNFTHRIILPSSYWHSFLSVFQILNIKVVLWPNDVAQNSNFLISVMNEPDYLLSPVQSPVLERQSHSKMAE